LKKLFPVILLMVGLLAGTAFQGLGDDSKCRRSTEGKEFWFGFMQGRRISNNHFVEITVTSQQNASFSISIGNNLFNSYQIGANSPLQIRIPYTLVEPTVSETILKMGIHLVSDTPVNVYAYNHDDSSSDIAVMYPVESLGTEYYAMCYTPHVYASNTDHGRNSEFVVVASQDNTQVTIKPSVTSDGSHAANVPYSVTLNTGDLYQVQALSGDLTGSYITSDKPVAVYAGSLSTTIPLSATNGWDHLYEQMPPVKTWGREYYTVPLQTRSKDYFRILASQDSTTVFIGTGKQILNKGKYYEFTLNTATRIYSDKPILICQYSQSKSNDNVTYSDGFMIILSPVSQAKNDVTFVSYSATKIYSWYVNIVVPVSEIGNIELAGSIIPSSSFTPFSNGKYAYAQLPISSGPYRLRDINPDRGFIAYVYAFGANEGYGYGVGFNLNLVLDLSDGLKTLPNLSDIGDSIVICQGNLLKLDAGPYFDKYLWSTNDSVQEISVSTQGLYKITASTIDGCIQEDSIFLTVDDPKIDLGEDKSGCSPYSVTLDGGKEFVDFNWNTSDTTRQVTVSSSGQYSVEVQDKWGCRAKDAMNLTVFPVPDVQIPDSLHYCGSMTGQVEVILSGTDESVWKQGSFKWETDQPGKLSFAESSFTSTRFNVTSWGNYKIFYTLTTTANCQVKDTIDVGMFQVPTSSFTFTDNPEDKCKGYSREILFTGQASPDASLYWDYGGCQLIEKIDWQRARVSVGVYNTNPFISLYVEENGCHSDTTKRAIGANPDFTMNTVKSRGCDSATIYFSGELKVPDALLFEWDFGDGSPLSNLQKPSHFYSKTGSYDVSLLITNQLTGCKTGFLVDDMVKIFPTPVARMSADPAVCYGDTIPVVYTLNMDSSLCYWQFEGAHQYKEGNDSILVVIDQPVATLGLQVEEFGCPSARIETVVKRKPNFDFTAVPTEGCQPMEVDLKSTKADLLLDFTWKTDTMLASGNGVNLLYIRPGKFPVMLSAVSTETGCRDTLTKNDFILVHPKPTSQFTVDYPVAILGQSKLSFSDQSLLAENYHWDFGDGSASSERNPEHNYTERGLFPAELVVGSEFGCRDTSVFEVEIVSMDVYSPNAFRPGSEIPGNQVFMPVSHGIDAGKFHLRIFNRWGEMVFESKSLDNPWDGKLKNGLNAPMGNYVWKAVYTDIQGFAHQKIGQVLLIR